MIRRVSVFQSALGRNASRLPAVRAKASAVPVRPQALDVKFEWLAQEINALDGIYSLRKIHVPQPMQQTLGRLPNVNGVLILMLPALLAQDYPTGGVRKEPHSPYARHFHHLQPPPNTDSQGISAKIKPLRLFFIDVFFEPQPQAIGHMLLDLQQAATFDRVLSLPTLAERLSDLNPSNPGHFVHHAMGRLPAFHQRLHQKRFIPTLFDAITQSLVMPLAERWNAESGDSLRRIVEELSATDAYIDLAWFLLPVWLLHYQVMRASKRFGPDQINAKALEMQALVHDVEENIFWPLKRFGGNYRAFNPAPCEAVRDRAEAAVEYWKNRFWNLDAFRNA